MIDEPQGGARRLRAAMVAYMCDIPYEVALKEQPYQLDEFWSDMANGLQRHIVLEIEH